MNIKRNLAAIILILGMIIIFSTTQTTLSQVAIGVRYHSGPVTLSFGNYPCYPYIYYPSGGYTYLRPHHHRHYRYYGHERYYHHVRGYRHRHRRHDWD
jgi:hypothetical protein